MVGEPFLELAPDPGIEVVKRCILLQRTHRPRPGKRDRDIDRAGAGIRMAQVPDCSGRNDECVRDVQRPGDELFPSAAGHGAGRDASRVFWQGERKDKGAVGGHPCLRDLLGTVPGARFQAAGSLKSAAFPGINRAFKK